MLVDMLISVDTKKIETHLSILREELKESIIIIEILMAIYQQMGNSNIILRQLNFMKKEKECIQEKIKMLEKSMNEFSKVKFNIDVTLNEAIEILNCYKMF